MFLGLVISDNDRLPGITNSVRADGNQVTKYY